MASLHDIGVSGFAGMAPTPVEKRAIDKYMVTDRLLNALQFVNIGMGTNVGNIQTTVLTYEKPIEAEYREIGQEYEVNNNPPVPKTFVLKQFGGEFQTDRVLNRAFSQNKNAVENWTEQQVRQHINGVKIKFNKEFMLGDSTKDPKQFDGLDKFLKDNPTQDNANPYVLEGGLSDTNALKAENALNEMIAKVAPQVDFLITTRTKGGPFLKTLSSYRHRGANVINVYDTAYNTYAGIPIIELEDYCFDPEILKKGIPFYAIHVSEDDGIRVAVPMNPSTSGGIVIDIVLPRVGNTDAGQAVFVRNGGVEFCGVPIIVDPFCAARCIISDTASTPVTGITVNGAATIDTDGGTSKYTASVTPDEATNKNVTWSVSDPSKATITQDGTVTAVANGSVDVTATAQDGSKVSGKKSVTISNQT